MQSNMIEFHSRMRERRGPLEGTVTSSIIKMLQEGKVHTEIVEGTGLSSRQVTSLKNNIYRKGYLAKPTEEKRRESWRISHPGHPVSEDTRKKLSLARENKFLTSEQLKQLENLALLKSTTWNQIKRYVDWGMYPSEILLAVFLEKGVELSLYRIHKSLNYARRTGKVGYSTPEESKRIRQEAKEPETKRKQRVISWLSTANILGENGLDKMPETRSDWLLVVDYYDARIERSRGNRETMVRFNKALDGLGQDRLNEIKPYINAIRDSGPMLPSPSREMLKNVMVTHGEVNIDEFDL